MEKIRVKFEPSGREVSVAPGSTLKEAIVEGGLYFEFPCGGRGKCKKCLVQVLKGGQEPTLLEKEHFSEKEIEEGFRLACRTTLQEGATVQLFPEKISEHKIQLETTYKEIPIEAHIHKNFLEIQEPSLEDPRSDYQRLTDALGEGELDMKLPLILSMPRILREADFRVTGIWEEGEILGIEEGDTTSRLLGIAFDVGTTTIAGYLADLSTGEELAVVSASNPQSTYGSDVISRITYAVENKEGLKNLKAAVIKSLKDLIKKATDKGGVEQRDIYGVTVVGNTSMHHLLLGIDPGQLAFQPFVPAIKRALKIRAEELDLGINPAGNLYMLPLVSGYVGADAVAVILDTGIDESENIKLALDIGTNGEIMLGSRERILACSAAAGPAFEGPQITSGMRASPGAINQVNLKNGQLNISVIGEEKPQGICGSGLIDAVALLLKLGIINPRGRILSPGEVDSPEGTRLKDRIVKYKEANAFILVEGAQTQKGRDLYITQKDVRELQLGKGAIYTGIKILMDHYSLDFSQVDQVLLAGTFGNFLDPRSACTIGLIPPELYEKIKGAGNAAGTGARAALLSRREYRRAEEIAKFTEYVELSSHPQFNKLFARNTLFPDPPVSFD